jgi:predicted membrane metal-binding protein
MLRGLIVSDTGYRADDATVAGEPNRMSFRLRLEALKRGEDWATASGQLFVFVSEKRPPQALRYGDAIECSAILRVPPPARNPGTFDWRAWLARHNIHFTATIRKTDVCVVTEVERGHPALAW